jgi:hypothetical protein
MTFRPIAISLLLAALLGCAHGRLEPGTTRIPNPVGTVEVATVPDLPADRIARYRELDGDGLIRGAIERELTAAGAWQPGVDAAIAVTVTNFRLRSAGNAFWNGFFAGSDLLDGQIEIRRGSAPPERIAFKFSGNEDEYFKFSAGARFRSLADALAREIRAHVDAR